MRKGIALLDYLFALRPILFFPVWVFFLAGLWGSAVIGGNTVLSGNIILGFINITLVMGSVYIFNQLQDIETDQLNQKRFIIATGLISVKAAVIEAIILSFIGLSLAVFVNWIYFICYLLLFIFTGWLYNYPPAQWKNRPVMGVLTNGFGGLLIYLLGWYCTNSSTHFPISSVAYLFGCMAIAVNTTLPDIKGDEKTGKITFGVRFGLNMSALWAFLFEMIAILLAWACHDWILFIPAVLVLPLFIVGLYKRTMKSIMRATIYSVFAFAVSVIYHFPWFVILVLITFWGTRWYYQKRFHYSYPNLKGT